MAHFQWPPVEVSAAPVQYIKDGVDTQVSIDTAVPTNSTPLPVQLLDSAGLPSDYATEAKQDTQITQLGTINTAVQSIDTKVLTDAQLRASPVPVSGPLTDTQLRASAVPVSAASLPLPTGAATETTLASIDSKVLTDTQLRASALAVSGPLTDTELRASAVPVSMASAPLPTGAATEATLSALNGKVTAVNTGAVVVASSALPTGAATEATLVSIDAKVLTDTQLRATPVPVSGPLTDTQLRATAVPVSAASLPLPSGAATEATLSALNGKVTAVNTGAVVVASSALPTGAATEATLAAASAKLPATLGQKTSAGSLAVVMASDQTSLPTAEAGYVRAHAPTRIDYTGSPVTTAAYTTLVASASAAIKQLQIFDSSGQTLVLAIGAAASEVDQIYIPPGGTIVNLAIPASTRISIKAVTANATSGYIAVTFLG